MDKNILQEYMDACRLVEETEQELKRLNLKKRTIVQTNVKGSNPEFPYQAQHFRIQGTTFTVQDDSKIRYEMMTLEKRKEKAESIKLQVEEWITSLPMRMQRIVKYRYLDGLPWAQVAVKMGKKATENGIKKEFERFMKKN